MFPFAVFKGINLTQEEDMLQKDLQEQIQDLNELKAFSFDLERISTFQKPQSNTIIFIKDKKNLKKFQNLLPENKYNNICFIIDEKIESDFSELSEVLDKNISEYGILKTNAFDLNLAQASKVFFDMISQDWNDEIDGRKTGTVEIHPTAVVSPDAFLGKNVSIAAGVKIHSGVRILSGSSIGENSIVFPNVVIYQNVQIGKDVRLHANTVIGSDGYGYNFVNYTHHKIYHFGGVIIGDNVEIGSNSSVDSGTFSPTMIGAGTKLDNLVQVAHNVELGQGVIICSQSGVAGSTTVGDFTVIGGATAVTDHIVVGKGCQIGGKAGVTNNLEDGAIVAGFPARPVKEWLRGVAQIRKLAKK